MTTTIFKEAPAGLCVVQVDSLTKPAWVERLFTAGAATSEAALGRDLSLQVTETEDLAHLQVVLVDAVTLAPAQLERGVREVYALIRDELAKRRACHPLRFWNFVPCIHRPVPGGISHYEVFNAGRFAAFTDWYRSRSFGAHMVAASGVGHHSPHLLVQVLAGERPGQGIENPRQRSAYRYSKRYGPLPPCFARATVVEALPGGADQRLMILSGTASVVGEDSCHDGDLGRQLIETCSNLKSLVEYAKADNVRGKGCASDPLGRFQELRVYLVDATRRESLAELLTTHFPNLRHLELMPADLCRTDLMIEVEGIVSLS